jgi:glycosyltransferase involved in cell wall biosynthesis
VVDDDVRVVDVTGAKVIHVCTVDLSLRYLLGNQLRFLQREGYDVVGVSSPGPDVPWLRDRGIRHVPVAMTRTFDPRGDAGALLDLQRVFARERPDIVHTHTPKGGLLGQLAARMAGVPVVVNTLHGFYFHEHMAPWSRRFYVLMEQVAAAASDHILSQNPEDIATAVAEHIAPPERLELLGNGIDLQRFSPEAVDDDERLATRNACGFGPDDVVVGFVGRLVREKGVVELMEAIARVRRQHPRVRLLVVGPVDVDKPDALSPACAADAGVDDITHFAGFRSDLPALYAAMDLLVLPSWREGFPRVPMEAAAMTRPVVVTDIRGCREVVVDGVTGLLVPVRDVAALAVGIAALVENAPRRQALGRAGRLLAERKFDERAVFAKVVATYQRLLRARARR